MPHYGLFEVFRGYFVRLGVLRGAYTWELVCGMLELVHVYELDWVCTAGTIQRYYTGMIVQYRRFSRVR